VGALALVFVIIVVEYAAVLFSAKHAVIDASMGRMLAITVLGVVLGLVAHKATWRASALSHIVMNSVATAGVIIYGLFQSTQVCAVPQPTPSPELQQATDRIVALIDTRDRTEIEALFTPAFITSVTEDESVRVLESVHTMEGKCRFRCVVSLDGSRGATELLACDHGTEWMRVHLEEGPPHRVDGILMHPALVP